MTEGRRTVKLIRRNGDGTYVIVGRGSTILKPRTKSSMKRKDSAALVDVKRDETLTFSPDRGVSRSSFEKAKLRAGQVLSEAIRRQMNIHG